ncbi:MAG: hypothetical protein JWO82_2002 [Akkermansiaceae bacterium]|nr:hypothetical protein [Akkermansiaceae bacterium]
MRPHAALPYLAAGIIALAAVTLTVRTATLRDAARQTEGMTAKEAGGTPSTDTGNGASRPFAFTRLPPGSESRTAELRKQIARVMASRQRFEHESALLALLRELAPGDFPIALDAIVHGAGNDDYDDAPFLFTQWMRTAPQDALTYAQSHPDLERPLLEAWVQSDPAAALDRARQKKPAEESRRLLGQMFFAVSRQEPQAALKLLDELSPQERESPLEELAGRGTPAQFAATLEWAAGLKDPDERTAALQKMLLHWNQAHSAREFELLLTLPDPAKSLSKGYDLYHWAERAPDEALAGFNRIPEGPFQAAAVRQMAPGLIAGGREDAADAILARYPETMTPFLRQTCISLIAPHDLERAIAMAAEIRDPFYRENGTIVALQACLEHGGDAARQAEEWTASHELSPKLQQFMEVYRGKPSQ